MIPKLLIFHLLRQRATAVIGISGLASSLLGREALKSPSGFVLWLNMGAYEWDAIICMVISVVCTFHILKPKTGWVFHFSPSNINNQFTKGKLSTLQSFQNFETIVSILF